MGRFRHPKHRQRRFAQWRSDRLGEPVAWNTAFQYHLRTYFWPEVETNYTWYPDGERTGKNQLFITPGLLLGRFPIWQRVKFNVGAGFRSR